MKLAGKTAIITGSARGIGRAAVAAFAAEGARVALFDIDEAGMAETVRGAGREADCLAVRVDVTSSDSVRSGVEKTLSQFGRIDILYNNAAYNKDFKAALDTSDEDWAREVDVTLKGSFLCARAVIPHMLTQGGGVIINTGSWLAHAAFPNYCAYSAAKGGVVQLTRSLAVDYSPRNIRVNLISPGAVDTPAFDPFRDQPEFMQAVYDLTLMGRIARPEEVARVAVFLASDDASYITGAVIPVDGGASAKLG